MTHGKRLIQVTQGTIKEFPMPDPNQKQAAKKSKKKGKQ